MAKRATEDVAPTASQVRDTIKGTRDILAVHRVFGEAYEADGATIIPVARVKGGAGGGAGEGGTDDEGGSGFGSGFGLTATPVGVYEIRDGVTTWKPAMDINRVTKGGQVLAGIAVVAAALVLLRLRS